jgi:UDP-N-acetylmuramate dehydrogenase
MKKVIRSIKENEPLIYRTSVRIGGSAQYFIEAHSIDNLINAVRWANESGLPVTLLGAGTNVLISDSGILGLVIRNYAEELNIADKESKKTDAEPKKQKSTAADSKHSSRWESDQKKGTFRGIEFKDLDYDESKYPRIDVEIESGASLPKTINYLLDRGITGLQWFAGIPGTIGGAVFNNIHGGSHFLSEYIKEVEVLDSEGNNKSLKTEDLGMDYDKSRFHHSQELILKTKLTLSKGDVRRAKSTALEWRKRKSIQPKNSPGCVFKNISREDREKLGYPTTSTGYIIEHVLKMSGYSEGDAKISDVHANFIVNTGNATAEDYLKIIKMVRRRAKNETGLSLEPEIVFLGFDPEEIQSLYF